MPALVRLFWGIDTVRIPFQSNYVIENTLLTIVLFGKTLWVQTQPATNLGSNIQCVFDLCPNGFRTFLMRPTLFSVETMQNYVWTMLSKILLRTQALCVLRPPTFQEYIACVPWNATSTPTP